MSVFDTGELLYNPFDQQYQDVLEYIKMHALIAVKNKAKEGYIKRYFYTQAGFHKHNIAYAGQKVLYHISRAIARADG